MNLRVADMSGGSVNDRDGLKHVKACAHRSKSRVRLNLDQKRHVYFGLLTQRVSHTEIACPFKISRRGVWNESRI